MAAIAPPGGKRPGAAAGSPPRCASAASAPATWWRVMAPNTPPTLEAHFAVPMAGAVLNALNVRLDAETIAYVLSHGEAKLLITDREFSTTVAAALAMMAPEQRPIVVDVDDALAPPGALLGEIEYEAFLAGGDPAFQGALPADEWDAITLNYTSGTTGRPEGCRLPPSRRISERHRQRRYLGDAAPSGVSLDAADVPLQRLVLPVDGHRTGRHPCLPTPGRGGGYPARAGRGRRHPYVRRADHHGPDPERARHAAPRPAGAHDDRGRRPARRRDRRDGAAELCRHPCLRPDGMLRPRHRLRVARRVGTRCRPSSAPR